jgi:hypothetical protein
MSTPKVSRHKPPTPNEGVRRNRNEVDLAQQVPRELRVHEKKPAVRNETDEHRATSIVRNLNHRGMKRRLSARENNVAHTQRVEVLDDPVPVSGRSWFRCAAVAPDGAVRAPHIALVGQYQARRSRTFRNKAQSDPCRAHKTPNRESHMLLPSHDMTRTPHMRQVRNWSRSQMLCVKIEIIHAAASRGPRLPKCLPHYAIIWLVESVYR